MDQFVVSARKYRPSDFKSVVGQGSVTTTLKNAIQRSQLAQAFLFCGPRGVGKTTCSRILAKTINCTNLTENIEACNTCDSCTSFNDGKSFNVYELDAASNNSVDDIRSLIEQVQYPPQDGKYKVYIIDEVHMLSTAAFNAFLKTLEEPPSYAIFILATTEKHKILPTILSRCQIFDFKRIQIKDITMHLKYIAEKEGVVTEDSALHIIAQKADGALRDALSLFDQLATFTANKLTYEEVVKNLNILDYEYFFKVTDQFLSGDITGALLSFNDILNQGFDGHHFIIGLSDHYRNLMVASDERSVQLLEVSNQFKEKYQTQSASYSKELLLESLALVNQADLSYKTSQNQRLLVELMLMKLCSLLKGVEKKKSKHLRILPPSEVLAGKLAKTPFLVDEKAAPKEVETVQNKAIDNYSELPNDSDHSYSPLLTEKQATEKAKVQTENTKLEPLSTSSPKTQSAKSSRTISINDFLAQKDEKKEEERAAAAVAKRETPYTKEDFFTSWNDYATKMELAGKKNLHSILKSLPVLIDNVAKVNISNSALKDEFETEKTELISFLRNTLKNDLIKIDYEIVVTEISTKLFTSKDRFSKLVEINPEIQKLKDAFDLEVEM